MIYFFLYLVLFMAGYIVFYNIKIRERILGWKNLKHIRLGKTGVVILNLMVFSISFFLFYILLKSVVASAAVAFLPVIGVFSLIDIIDKYWEDREMKQITFFLMTMAKWASVKNDLVYCLKKADETSMKKPLGVMVNTTLGRIYGGMAPTAAFGLLEKESRSEDLRYLIKNIRFAAEKGGSLRNLFKGMEEQYFKIDEEFFKRRISTLRDRMAVYFTIFAVAGTGIWFIVSNPIARTFYLSSFKGNLMLMMFVLVFGTGIMIMTKGRK